MGVPFKILTYNVHRGRSAIRRRDICESIAKILDFSSADAVCLQEVWQDEGIDDHRLAPHLCDVRWPHRVFSKTVDLPGGLQGNAILSQRPVSEWAHFDVSVPHREPRGMLHSVVQAPGALPVTVFNVHLGLSRAERRAQVELLVRFIDIQTDPHAPLVILGDFNDWRRELTPYFREELAVSEAIVERRGRHGATYPALLPVLSLDRIYYRNCRLLEARIVRERQCLRLSDHLPVEAVFELPRGAPAAATGKLPGAPDGQVLNR
jgi:endonuclease/exonuclease/phosphatase family metal-dependent hydrolase